jgi:mRNA interferase RelE/StbE
MKFVRLSTFDKCYDKLHPDIKQQAKEKFALFRNNPNYPFHPSLRVKKMQGHETIMEGHVTMDCVFTFTQEIDKNTGEIIFYFRKIGTHDIYKNP